MSQHVNLFGWPTWNQVPTVDCIALAVFAFDAKTESSQFSTLKSWIGERKDKLAVVCARDAMSNAVLAAAFSVGFGPNQELCFGDDALLGKLLPKLREYHAGTSPAKDENENRAELKPNRADTPPASPRGDGTLPTPRGHGASEQSTAFGQSAQMPSGTPPTNMLPSVVPPMPRK